MSPTNYLSNVHRMREEFYNAHSPEALAAFLAEDFTFYAGSVGPIKGAEAYASAMRKFFVGIPDANMEEADTLVDGTKVCVRANIVGTHLGMLWGVSPTGKQIRWSANFIYRFEGDRLAELWANEDWAAILGAIGYCDLPFAR
jgi:predicted ester cyclase